MVIPDPTAYETSAGGPFMRDINYVNPPRPCNSHPSQTNKPPRTTAATTTLFTGT